MMENVSGFVEKTDSMHVSRATLSLLSEKIRIKANYENFWEDGHCGASAGAGGGRESITGVGSSVAEGPEALGCSA